MALYPFFCALLVYILCIHAGTATSTLINRCETATDCQECINRDPECVWCTEVPKSKIHCMLRNETYSTCYDVDQSTAEERTVMIKKAKPVRPKRPITPQKVAVGLRKGGSVTMEFKVLARKRSIELNLRHSRTFGVTVQSNCTGFKYTKKRVVCKGISPGEIHFSLTIKAKRCLSKPKKVKVTVNNNKKKTLKIQVTTLCSCECEKEENQVKYSSRCNGNGAYVCGQCKCLESFSGEDCSCDTERNPVEMCIPPGNGSALCSSRGECICGMCVCFPTRAGSGRRFTGRYCECDDFSCDYYNGQICGGNSRGLCRCGSCVCQPGFSGQACQIEVAPAEEPCRSPRTKEICNGNGLCVNNKCECLGTYRGPTCDQCGDEPWKCSGVCAGLRSCVECVAFGSGPFSKEECLEKCRNVRHSFSLVDDVAVEERGGRNFRLCMLRDEDGCLFKFAYDFSATESTQIKIETRKMCPSK